MTAFISPTEFAAISTRCRDSKHSVQLRFETTVVTDGIPQVPVPDHFVMHAELAAVRHQVGRKSSALALYDVHAMNGTSLHASKSELTVLQRATHVWWSLVWIVARHRFCTVPPSVLDTRSSHVQQCLFREPLEGLCRT